MPSSNTLTSFSDLQSSTSFVQLVQESPQMQLYILITKELTYKVLLIHFNIKQIHTFLGIAMSEIQIKDYGN
jgi:hypothetical protein